ncbi:MAG: hypothetical protein Q7R93_02050 [bacterium]|nr:hypothetical protein [bacterium]
MNIYCRFPKGTHVVPISDTEDIVSLNGQRTINVRPGMVLIVETVGDDGIDAYFNFAGHAGAFPIAKFTEQALELAS